MFCKLFVVLFVVFYSCSATCPNYTLTTGEQENVDRLKSSVDLYKEKTVAIMNTKYISDEALLEQLEEFYESLEERAKEEAAYYQHGIKFLTDAVKDPAAKCVTFTAQEIYQRKQALGL